MALSDSEAVWWNQMTPSARLMYLFLRHAGNDDPQYRKHMEAFSKLSFSELQWSGQASVKSLHEKFGSK